MNNFDTENKARWEGTLETVFPNGIPESASWTELDEIIRILHPFCAEYLNHTTMPSGFGQNMVRLTSSKEPGCIEFHPGPKPAYLCQPFRLCFEHIQQAPWQSFFLLEAAELATSGVYESLSDQQEVVLELPDGHYMEITNWDDGHIGYDESGEEIPIPDPHRLVVRHLSGKFLIVAERSLWSLDRRKHCGLHNQMSPSEIRVQIEALLSQMTTQEGSQMNQYQENIDDERNFRELSRYHWIIGAKRERALPEKNWNVLYYYYQAAIVNNYDIASYLHLIFENRSLFETIGATKTLAAADELRPLFKDGSLTLHDKPVGFWDENKERFEAATRSADGISEFAKLLVAYAEANIEIPRP